MYGRALELNQNRHTKPQAPLVSWTKRIQKG